MVNAWLAGDGEKLRSWLVERTPDLLHGMIETLPLWAAAILGALVFIAGLWAVIQIFQGAVSFLQFLWGLVTRPFTTARETFVPSEKARKTEVDALQGKVVAQESALAEQGTLLAQIKAQLDRMEAAQVAAGAAPLGTDERARRDAAIEGLVAEKAPATDSAAHRIVEGDIAGAIEALEQDARSDVVASAEKWRRIGALVLGVDTAKAREAFEEAFRLQADDFWTCIELARLRREAGDLAGARLAAEAAGQAANDDWERSVFVDEVGIVVQESGDLGGARRHFDESLEIRKRLVRDKPAVEEYQRGLAVSFNNIGNILGSLGDIEGALRAYEAAVPITLLLVENSHGSAEARRDLASSHGSIGQMHLDAGDIEGARQQFALALQMSEGLAQDYPSSELLQGDISLNLERLGDVMLEANEVAEAKQYYEAALDISARLAHENPGSALAQRNLSRQRAALGDLLLMTGDLPAARQQFEMGLAALEPLAHRNPDSVYFQSDLYAMFEGLSDILAESGDREGAIARMRQSYQLVQALAAKHPERQHFQEDAKAARARLAELEAGN